MATITSAASGNFSVGATWVGGVVPAAGDIAVAATGHVVTIDTNITVTELQQAGTGYFSVTAARTITALVRGVAGLWTSSIGTLVINTASNVTIAGNIAHTGGITTSCAVVKMGTGLLTVNGTITPGSTTNQYGIYMTDGNLIVNGNISSGTGAGAHAIATPSTATANIGITVNGNVTMLLGGTGCHVINANHSAGFISITGTVTALGVRDSYSINSQGASTAITIVGDCLHQGLNNTYATGVLLAAGTNANVTVVGNVTGGNGTASNHALHLNGASIVASITGTITGGSASSTTLSSCGVSVGAATTPSASVTIVGSLVAGQASACHALSYPNTFTPNLTITGNLVDSTFATAVFARAYRVNATTATTTYRSPAGAAVVRASLDYIPNNVPIPANVRSGTVYGNNQYTGTLAVPPANSVASGVPVDNTTGTAALSPADIAALVGAQIAAASSSPIGA